MEERSAMRVAHAAEHSGTDQRRAVDSVGHQQKPASLNGKRLREVGRAKVTRCLHRRCEKRYTRNPVGNDERMRRAVSAGKYDRVRKLSYQLRSKDVSAGQDNGSRSPRPYGRNLREDPIGKRAKIRRDVSQAVALNEIAQVVEFGVTDGDFRRSSPGGSWRRGGPENVS